MLVQLGSTEVKFTEVRDVWSYAPRDIVRVRAYEEQPDPNAPAELCGCDDDSDQGNWVLEITSYGSDTPQKFLLRKITNQPTWVGTSNASRAAGARQAVLDLTAFMRSSPPVPGTGVWGSITGVLTDQTDLKTALDLKADQADLVTEIADRIAGDASTLASAEAYADGLVIGLFDDRGNWDASSNLFPATGGSGVAGAILKGDVWRVSVVGTLGGELADVGDSFRALVDTPGQTAGNWALFAANTQQATESIRGTLAVATQAEAEDNASTNDIDAVTPKKWWQAWTIGITLPAWISAVQSAAPAETTVTEGALINGATAKTTPVDADFVGLMDSAASNVLKKLSWANIKATLKAYFDAIYEPLGTPVFMAYTGGSQVNSTTTYADVDASAVLPVPAAGLYEVVIRIVYNANATTTGAGFSLNGPAFNFLSSVVNYDTLSTNRAAYAQITYDWGVVASSSRDTTGNYASIIAHIRLTASGTLALRFRSKVGGAAITVTGVTGFIKQIG